MTVDTHLERLHTLESGHFWSVGRDHLTRVLMARYRFRDPILDVGAGTGAFARKLMQEGRRVHWFDVGQVTPPGFVASLTQIPLRDNAAGAVLARDVIEHVDDRAAMEEICRVLQPDGHALITVPGWPSLWSERDEEAGHLRRYRRRDLRALVEDLPVDVIALHGYQFLLLPVVIGSRKLSRVSTKHSVRTEERIPSRGINRIFSLINRFEGSLARQGLGPPTGSSLVMVVRRR